MTALPPRPTPDGTWLQEDTTYPAIVVRPGDPTSTHEPGELVVIITPDGGRLRATVTETDPDGRITRVVAS